MERQSTMAGKQSVAYRMLTNKGLELIIEMPKATALILLKIINHSDKHDNCLQLSTTELIFMYNLNQSNTYKHIRELRNINFIKEVLDINNATCLMINPEFISWQSRSKIRFSMLMYTLGSHHGATTLRNSEQQQGGRINPTTGEVRDWFYEGLEIANEQHNICPNTGYEYAITNNQNSAAPTNTA